MHKRKLGIARPILLATLGLLVFASVSVAVNLKDGGTAGKFKVDTLFTLAPNRTFTGQLEQLTGKTTVHFVYLIPAANVAL
jgi:hypothetical protein